MQFNLQQTEEQANVKPFERIGMGSSTAILIFFIATVCIMLHQNSLQETKSEHVFICLVMTGFQSWIFSL